MIAFAVFAAGFGAILGSFLNVVIHRVPRGESVVRPASRCPGCGSAVLPRDNVPVVSWVVLRGRCRSCGEPIAVRYPLVEASTAALWAVSAIRIPTVEGSVFVGAVGSVLLALAVIDLEHHRLPNAIVVPGIAAAMTWMLVYSAVTGDWTATAWAALGGGTAFLLLFAIALTTGGMGFGDVKLAALIGIATGRFGWEVVVEAVFVAFVVGGLVALILLVAGRTGRKEAVPFGPWLAVGTMVALFAGPGPVRAWLGL